MLLKNTAGQGLYLFAYTVSTGVAKTGDAASITGAWSKDGGAETAGYTTAHPTEIGGGIYWQPLTQAETNGNALAFRWASGTSGVVINPAIVLSTGVNLPVAAPAASGGLLTVGTGSGQISPASGAVAVSDKTGFSLAASQTFSMTGNITGNLSGSVGSVTGAVGSVTGDVGGTIVGTPTWAASDTGVADAVATQASIAAALSTISTNLNATVSSRSTYAGADTAGTTTLMSLLTATRAGYLDNLATAPPTAAAIATAVLTTQMTESYNADGTAPTLAQAQLVTMQRLTDFAISGTAITVNKLDGATPAYTLALDSATAPTSSTRDS